MSPSEAVPPADALGLPFPNFIPARTRGITYSGMSAGAQQQPAAAERVSAQPYIYVASSWRNPIQPDVVAALREAGNGVYDFRNPAGGTGFAWSSIDPDWQSWTAREYAAALDHPLAVRGYASDFEAMQRADLVVLVLPCGRSAHLELGWAVGAGKRTAILTRDGEEPELMAKMVDLITDDLAEIVAWAAQQPAGDEQVSVQPWQHAGHAPVQHRDGMPPWCRECGWTSPTPAVPARQIRPGT